ncbi:hypothetical protein Tco_0789415 [Tanacetum coccineum]
MPTETRSSFNADEEGLRTTIAVMIREGMEKLREEMRNTALTQKEYEEKRAKNLCFYCDKKFVPGHKCPSKMYSLEVLASTKENGDEWEEEQKDKDC